MTTTAAQPSVCATWREAVHVREVGHAAMTSAQIYATDCHRAAALDCAHQFVQLARGILATVHSAALPAGAVAALLDSAGDARRVAASWFRRASAQAEWATHLEAALQHPVAAVASMEPWELELLCEMRTHDGGWVAVYQPGAYVEYDATGRCVAGIAADGRHPM